MYIYIKLESALYCCSAIRVNSSTIFLYLRRVTLKPIHIQLESSLYCSGSEGKKNHEERVAVVTLLCGADVKLTGPVLTDLGAGGVFRVQPGCLANPDTWVYTYM